jgi:hypothetical protein
MKRLVNRLVAANPQVLRIALPLGVLLVALECWLLALRLPVQQWRTLRAERAALAEAAQPISAADVASKRQALQRLQAELGPPAALDAEPESGLMPLMGRLDALAQRHGVLLGTVRPAGRVPMAGLLQTDHEVSARGRYPALAAWLASVATELAPLTLAELNFHALNGADTIELTLRLSDIRPVATAASASGATP